MRRVGVHVVGDEQIEVAVAVEIGERAARAPQPGAADARGAGDVGEDSVAAVVVQHVRAEVRDVEIDPAVVVVVAGAGAHAVLAMLDAGPGRDVLERAVAAVPVQAVPRLLRDRRIGERSAVDQEDVDPAVVVVVEEQPARAHGLDQVFVGARAVDVAEVHAGLAADIREPHGRSLWPVVPLAPDGTATDDDPGRDNGGDEQDRLQAGSGSAAASGRAAQARASRAKREIDDAGFTRRCSRTV